MKNITISDEVYAVLVKAKGAAMQKTGHVVSLNDVIGAAFIKKRRKHAKTTNAENKEA